MNCPNCNSEEVFKETLNQNGMYYLECPNCGVHFINNTALKADTDETYFRESYAAMALQGILSNPVYLNELKVTAAENDEDTCDVVAQMCKVYADALADELKKGK